MGHHSRGTVITDRGTQQFVVQFLFLLMVDGNEVDVPGLSLVRRACLAFLYCSTCGDLHVNGKAGGDRKPRFND